MPALDEANIVYEIEKANQDIREQLGPKHTFSIEAPYGIDDPRVRPIVASRFALTRNWVTDEFMDGFLRDDRRDPTTSKRDYVQWQRGPLARTTMEMMKSWVDTSIGRGIWLVLVFHGIEGIGWEALTTETMRAYLDYIKEHQGHMWIATFQDGARYARERVNSTVRTNVSGEAIEVSVTSHVEAGRVRSSADRANYDPRRLATGAIPSGRRRPLAAGSPRGRRTVRDVSDRSERKTRAIRESRELTGSRELNAPEQNLALSF